MLSALHQRTTSGPVAKMVKHRMKLLLIEAMLFSSVALSLVALTTRAWSSAKPPHPQGTIKVYVLQSEHTVPGTQVDTISVISAMLESEGYLIRRTSSTEPQELVSASSRTFAVVVGGASDLSTDSHRVFCRPWAKSPVGSNGIKRSEDPGWQGA